MTTKPDRFLKPVRFGLKVSEIIKAPFLRQLAKNNIPVRGLCNGLPLPYSINVGADIEGCPMV